MNTVEISNKQLENPIAPKAADTHPAVIGDVKRISISLWTGLRILALARREYHSVKKGLKVAKELVAFRNHVFGFPFAPKHIVHEGKYYTHLQMPGFPSPVFDRFALRSLNYYAPIRSKPDRLQSVIFAITKKCPLRCEHCFEWSELSSKDSLTTEQLHVVIDNFLTMGISQIFFSGGEPLVRFDDLLSLIKKAQGLAECWIYTSAFGLTREKAKRLKESGTLGVIVSVDHVEAEKHNAFRHHPQSFYWVEEGLKNAREAGLLTALSCCITKEFISEENLKAYMQKAKEWGVSFVQLLEPRAVGHFANKEVELDKNEKELLAKFYLHYLSDPWYKSDFPILTYPGYDQKDGACFMAGDRTIYVNASGDIQPCPFCQTKLGNMLDENAEEKLDGSPFCDVSKRWEETVKKIPNKEAGVREKVFELQS
ncbi:MAG: radical SAM protein [Chitinophagales bacterium]|nr:radical SAM protein [Chitinophagales bacterium]